MAQGVQPARRCVRSEKREIYHVGHQDHSYYLPEGKAAGSSLKLGFGKKFTDHMFVMDYTEGEGWHDARIVPYAPFPLDPATVVFHYAQEIFEGMKAYRTADDTIQLFRPECNAKRMQDSADRLCIPQDPC